MPNLRNIVAGSRHHLAAIGLVSCLLLPTWTAAQPAAQPTSALTIAPVQSLPGASAQIRIHLHQPLDIAAGGFAIELDHAVFGPISDVQVFSAAGDALGTAKLQGTRAEVRFSSVSSSVGKIANLPVAVVTAPILPQTEVGSTTDIVIDPTLEPWKSLTGQTLTVTASKGEVRIGGRLTLQNIMPIGPDTYRIRGTAFNPETRITAPGVPIAAVTYLSATELEFALAGPFELTGANLEAENPDREKALYVYTALTVPDPSADPTLRFFLPLRTYETIGVNAHHPEGDRVGLILENPYPHPVEITAEYISFDAVTFTFRGRSQLTLPAWGRLTVTSVGSLGYSNIVSSRVVINGGLLPDRPLRGIRTVRPCPRCQPTAVPATRELFGYTPYQLPLFSAAPLVFVHQPRATSPRSHEVSLSLGPWIFNLSPLTASTNQPWLKARVRPLSLSLEGGTVSVEIDGASFVPGWTYRGDVTITSGTQPRIQTIPVTAFARADDWVPPATPPLRLEALVPAALDLFMETGPKAIRLNTEVLLPPYWGPVAAKLSIQSGNHWLGGTSAGLLGRFLLSVDARSLPPGTYVGSVKVESSVTGESRVLPVRITIADFSVTVTPSVLGVGGPLVGIITVKTTGDPTEPVFANIALGPVGCRAQVMPATGPPQALTTTQVHITCGGAPGRNEGAAQVIVGTQSIRVPLKIDVPAVNDAGPFTPMITSVTSTASNRPGSIAAGQLVTLHGIGRNRSVTFDGLPATLLYESLFDARVVVPDAVRGPFTMIQVTAEGATAAFTVPVADSAPGLITLNGSGQGQSSIRNQDGSVNGADNPATRGSVIQIFATGIPQSGRLRVTLGGIEVPVLFVGPAAPPAGPGLVQIDVVIPAEAPPNPATAINLYVGDLAAQPGVTMAIH